MIAGGEGVRVNPEQRWVPPRGVDVPEPEPPPMYEPATSFKWVIVAAVVLWTLGGAIIFLKLL